MEEMKVASVTSKEMVYLTAGAGNGVSHLDNIDDDKSLEEIINDIAKEEGMTYDQALKLFQKGLKMMHGHNMNTNPKAKAKAKAKRKASKQARKRNRK